MARALLTINSPAHDEWPASTHVLAFTSGGANLTGVLHVPAGPGPHPVVVLLHEFPGYERNTDLAQALCRAGYAALVFDYRGSWGTGGSWSISHALEDAARVTSALRDRFTVEAYRLDPHRLTVLGHSVGGFAALMTAAADPTIATVISVAAPDIGSVAAACRADPSARAAYTAAADNHLLRACAKAAGSGSPPVRGASGESLVAEAERAGDAWRLTALGPLLASRPVLLIGASRDPVAPPAVHHQPVVNAYLAAHSAHLQHHVFTTDHALSGHRVALARTVLDFLRRNLPDPR